MQHKPLYHYVSFVQAFIQRKYNTRDSIKTESWKQRSHNVTELTGRTAVRDIHVMRKYERMHNEIFAVRSVKHVSWLTVMPICNLYTQPSQLHHLTAYLLALQQCKTSIELMPTESCNDLHHTAGWWHCWVCMINKWRLSADSTWVMFTVVIRCCH